MQLKGADAGVAGVEAGVAKEAKSLDAEAKKVVHAEAVAEVANFHLQWLQQPNYSCNVKQMEWVTKEITKGVAGLVVGVAT